MKEKTTLVSMLTILIILLTSCPNNVVNTPPQNSFSVSIDQNDTETVPGDICIFTMSLHNADIPDTDLTWYVNEEQHSTDASLVFTAPEGSNSYTIFLSAVYNGLTSTDSTTLTVTDTNSGEIPDKEEDPDVASYYKTASGLTGSALKDELHDILKSNITVFDYRELWEQLSYTDAHPTQSGKVLLLYTGWAYDASNHGGGVSQWNREHTWAKSHGNFGTSKGPGTDLHHLRPTDVSVNSARSNLDFDNGGSLYTDGDGATECRKDGDSWEPPNSVKGDVARMMFYMAVRYESEDGYDLELNDKVNNGTDPYIGRLSVLLNWHKSDPVDDWERRRNDRIEERQGNRNPFIDHPEWATEIWQ